MSNSVRKILPATILIIGLSFSLRCGGSGSSSSQQQNVTVNIASAPTAIGAGANWQYSASVQGTQDQTVKWSATAGTIDSTGLFIAPTTPPASPNVTITATSAANSSATASTTITVEATDPLGSVQSSSGKINCPVFAGGLPPDQSTCYQVNISCPGAADFSAYVKVNQPAGSPIGTVILGTGEGGSGLYDFDEPDFFNGTTNGGLAVVNGLLDAGFTTAQVSFGAPFDKSVPNGWLTGPGGVRRLACRYATLAQWIYNNVHSSTTIPFCATGNSGGAGAIGYALTDYGLGSIIAMVEATSGPPMSRLDQGCVQPSACQSTTYSCNGQTESMHMCYSTSESQIIDPAYAQPICTNAINGTAASAGLLLSDSVLGGRTPDFPNTYVNVVVGGQDTSSAVDQALTWEGSITSTFKNQACVSDAPHPLPSVQDGAQQIVSDIQAHCTLPPKSAAK